MQTPSISKLTSGAKVPRAPSSRAAALRRADRRAGRQGMTSSVKLDEAHDSPPFLDGFNFHHKCSENETKYRQYFAEFINFCLCSGNKRHLRKLYQAN